MELVVRRDNRPRNGLVAIVAGALFLALAVISVVKWRAPDYGAVHFINAAAQHSILLDHTFGDLSRVMLSNLLIVALLWGAWFGQDDLRTHALLLTGTFASMVASVISRGLQLALPSHPRPLHDPALGFRIPFAVNPEGLNHWSSFPSDHAALFFGLAVTIWFVNRQLGAIALVVAVIINFARIYLGFHFPSDVLGGAMLGIAIVGFSLPLSGSRPMVRLAEAANRHRALFYGIAFYISFGIVTLLQDYREVASGLMHHLHHHTM